ncbi:MAG TPA: histidine kinase, partial [Streptosporangiaceae bacterium]|nr:histidine kinase [Streptosporangiaceae bacterium]
MRVLRHRSAASDAAADSHALHQTPTFPQATAQPWARWAPDTSEPAHHEVALAQERLDCELEQELSTSRRIRRLILGGLLAAFVLAPAIAYVADHGDSFKSLFLGVGTVVFVAATVRVITINDVIRVSPRRRAAWLGLVVPLGALIYAVGGANWLTPLAVVAAGLGALLTNTRLAAVCIGFCCVFGAAVGLAEGFGPGATTIAAAVPALGGLLSFTSARRNALVVTLHQTRAELARMAVAQERLRIARDLHDLLGHSLSLIALKAELAGRLIDADPGRAAREVSELQAVARQSLGEVRQAVAGYRQPSLASELAAAEQMLASAHIECLVEAPDTSALPAAADALLAWTVREGTTNIVRHSKARHAEIRVDVTDTAASVNLTDDGVGPPSDVTGSGLAGSGLAGSGLAGSGLAGSGLAGSGLAGSGLAGS